MKFFTKKIIPLFQICVILFLMVFPAFALDDYQSSSANFWEYAIHYLSGLTDGVVWKDFIPVDKVIDLVGSCTFSWDTGNGVCALSGDSYHHADSIANCETGTDKHGSYALTTCKYCGLKFKYYSSDLKNQYNDAVKDLPAKGYGSDGGLYVPLNHLYSVIDTYSSGGFRYCSHYSSSGIAEKYGTVTCGIPTVYVAPSSSGVKFGRLWTAYKFVCNIDGVYSLSPGYQASISAIGSDGSLQTGTIVIDNPLGTGIVKAAGDTIQITIKGEYPNGFVAYKVTLNAPVPQLKVVPLEALNQYPVGSRPGAIIGDLSITNNNVTTKVENTSIINETNNTFYNPVTNNTYNMDGWTYDYSSRTYNFTINNVDNSVTYGDEYITIREGDTIYNIYYYINQDSGSGGDGDGCQHSYTSAITTAATCTTPGVETFTCSKCGNQYTQAIPVLGHDWLASEVTPDSYTLPEGTSCPDCGGTDFTFTLDQDSGVYTLTCSACEKVWTVQGKVTYGQTKYVCSRCGESYVETNDPDSGLFASIGNFFANGITWVVDKLKQLIDSLSGINDIFTSFIDDIKAKSGEYPAFLAAVIDVLPDDLMTVVWFSIIATIALIVWKLWFR